MTHWRIFPANCRKRAPIPAQPISATTRAKVKAETIKLEKEAEAVSISKKIGEISKQIGGADTTEKLKLIRDIITREQANYTVIENNNLDESYSKILAAANVINNKRK